MWLMKIFQEALEEGGYLPMDYAEKMAAVMYPDAQILGEHAVRILIALCIKVRDSGLIHFYHAMKEDNVEYTKQVLREKETNRTAVLLTASTLGSLKIVKFLIQVLVDIEACDDIGWTALGAAVSHGHISVVKELINAGAEINRGTRRRVTPLMLAAARGNAELVGFMLSKGADTSLRDVEGWTAGTYARQGGHTQRDRKSTRLNSSH